MEKEVLLLRKENEKLQRNINSNDSIQNSNDSIQYSSDSIQNSNDPNQNDSTSVI